MKHSILSEEIRFCYPFLSIRSTSKRNITNRESESADRFLNSSLIDDYIEIIRQLPTQSFVFSLSN